MRITGGLARSIPLKTANGADVRPATDQMREAVFSSLGEWIRDKHFIDLFAGSGSYGLEALSRGASGGIFVEKHRGSIGIIQQNIDAVCKSIRRENNCCRIYNQDVFAWTPKEDEQAEIVFIDPPYAMIAGQMQRLADIAYSCFSPDSESFLIFEHPADLEINVNGFDLIKRLGGKKKDAPCASILRKI